MENDGENNEELKVENPSEEAETTAAENTDTQSAEENVGSEQNVDASVEPEKQQKMLTQEQANKIIQQRVAREKREAQAELNKYQELTAVLQGALGTQDLGETTQKVKEFYKSQGLEVPETPNKPKYEDNEEKILAKAESSEIIDCGYDEIVSEVERLMKKGVNNMTTREKYMFQELATERKRQESINELKSIGVKEETLEDKNFKDFVKKFGDTTPIREIYDIYTKTVGQKEVPVPIGSMKNNASKEEKTYYTSEEVDKLTDKDYNDPKIMANVRKSMLSWK